MARMGMTADFYVEALEEAIVLYPSATSSS